MTTIIQLRDQPFPDACPAPDRCGGCGAATGHRHGTVLLYCLGLSHQGVEQALAPLGVQVDPVTVWRDLQELGARWRW